MLVKIENTTFRVRFIHYNPDLIDSKKSKAGTECEISNLNSPDSLPWLGQAYLFEVKHPKNGKKSDTFNKAIGRKTALTDALKNGKFSRSWRTVFWKEYWKQHAS